MNRFATKELLFANRRVFSQNELASVGNCTSGETASTGPQHLSVSHSPHAERNMKDQTVTVLRELATALSLAIDALSTPELPELDRPTDFYEEVKRFEIALIKRALKHTQGNQARAARLLGLNQPTLHGKIKQYGIRADIVNFREESQDRDLDLNLPHSNEPTEVRSNHEKQL